MPSILTAPDGRPRLPARRRGILLLWAVLLSGLLLAPTTVRADEKDGEGKKDEPAKTDEPAKEDGAAKPPAPKPILPQIQADEKLFRPIVDAARQYFDLDEEQWKGRTALMAELEAHAAEGRYFLKDMDALRWLVYEGRSFEPPLDDRKWQKAIGIQEFKKLGGTVETIRSEDWIFTYSIPKDYWKHKDFRSKYPRPAPLPLLLSMHDKSDYTNQKYPGDVLYKRRYPKKDWDALYDEWLLLCPIAAAGNFLDKTDMIRPLVFDSPLAEFWRHYHVDFDRIVLDGSEQAFVAAASKSVYFAGIIFRGDWTLESAEQKELVQNFASIPVYVVNNPKLAKQLEEAGHDGVTAGVGGKTLYTWMGERKRTPPKTYSWVVQPMRFDQVLPYWVNLDNPNWSAPKRALTVEVVDTEKEPNTIRIESEGINTLSLFLNDDIVDLDRKLRVTINGHIEFDSQVALQDERMAKVGRDFDFIFNREPLRIRTSMFFGWLTPARVVSLNVRPARIVEPPKDAEKKAEVPKASAADEAKAERYLRSARLLAEKGNVEGALSRLEKARELPPNKYTADIEELYQKLMKEKDAGK